MKQDDILTLEITDQGVGGEGIAKASDCVVFVPHTVVGDVVQAKVVHVKHNLVYASLRRVIRPSLHRITPVCEVFGACGGCDYLHVDYAYQLQCKQQQVATTLSKAKVTAQVAPCVPCSTPLGYRNKLMLPFGLVRGKVQLGFYRKNTHTVVPIRRCALHRDWNETLVAITLSCAETHRWVVYDSRTGKGLVRHLVARYWQQHLDVTLVATGDVPHWQEYAKALSQAFEDVTLYLSVNRQHNNVIMGDEVRLLYGRPATFAVDGVTTTLDPLSFLQVNDEIRSLIYNEVCRLVDAHRGSVVVDAFAGVGLLGAVMAKQGATVYNIEIVPQAVRDADHLAKVNGLGNMHNLLGDSAVQLPTLVEYLCQNAPAVHTMRLHFPYWQAIREGRKLYELRQNDEKRRAVAVGDLIAFVCQNPPDVGGDPAPNAGDVLYCRVLDKRVFPTFDALFGSLGTSETLGNPDISCTTAAASMLDIYPTPCADGVVAIRVQPVDVCGLAVVLDPPRKGCPPQVVQCLNDLAVRHAAMARLAARAVRVDGELVTLPFVDRVLYISCNPATLARDLATLRPAYTVQTVTPYDMFPNTCHVETVVRLSRSDINS